MFVVTRELSGPGLRLERQGEVGIIPLEPLSHLIRSGHAGTWPLSLPPPSFLLLSSGLQFSIFVAPESRRLNSLRTPPP